MQLRCSLLALAATLACGVMQAQSPDSLKTQAELEKTIAGLDAALFGAYNKCDLEKFASLVAEDVEFFHDKTGLMLGRKDLVAAIRTNICGKVTRELVPSSLQVFPMNGYGALEMGVHRFHHPGHEVPGSVGEGRFIQLWQYKDGLWKIARVISYDHHAIEK